MVNLPILTPPSPFLSGSKSLECSSSSARPRGWIRYSVPSSSCQILTTSVSGIITYLNLNIKTSRQLHLF
uniref:Uncharacterized protein n=1 Tax=Arundo donax TaxID=35708 RepID=A0A0A9DEX4_ARUDO